MMKMKHLILLGLPLFAAGLTAFSADAKAEETPGQETAPVAMLRLYNEQSGEHFYTASAEEKDQLVSLGWSFEGTGWMAPSTGDPVYRVYNENAGDHHYTTSQGERDSLVAGGWKDEGIGWYSEVNHDVPILRAYNPNAKAGSHNYTTERTEQSTLIHASWKHEGVAWYGTSNDYENASEGHKDKIAKYDALPDAIKTALCTAVVDDRAKGSDLEGYTLNYNFDMSFTYVQVHSGAGVGHPIFELGENRTSVIPIRGIVYQGPDKGYEYVDVPSPEAKWDLYDNYTINKDKVNAAASKASLHTDFTKASLDKLFADLP